MLLYLKRPFAALTAITLPLCKIYIRPHLNMLFKHPILSRDAETLEKVQKLGLTFVKGLRHVPYEAASAILSYTPANPR